MKTAEVWSSALDQLEVTARYITVGRTLQGDPILCLLRYWNPQSNMHLLCPSTVQSIVVSSTARQDDTACLTDIALP